MSTDRIDAHLPCLLPWVRVNLLIRQIKRCSSRLEAGRGRLHLTTVDILTGVLCHDKSRLARTIIDWETERNLTRAQEPPTS